MLAFMETARQSQRICEVQMQNRIMTECVEAKKRVFPNTLSNEQSQWTSMEWLWNTLLLQLCICVEWYAN